jgi:hypothetical protein
VQDTAVDCAKNFYRDIFKNHGLPDNIVSGRDSKFTSTFWKPLMELCGIKLKKSTSRHRQMDGSSEIMNRMIENYLRCYCCYRQMIGTNYCLTQSLRIIQLFLKTWECVYSVDLGDRRGDVEEEYSLEDR